jgi:hypothetical protein
MNKPLHVNGKKCNKSSLSTLIFYYHNVDCTVDDVECVAKEAHFGGIVVLTK